jgi:phytol kinase
MHQTSRNTHHASCITQFALQIFTPMNDLIAIAISFVYVFASIGIAEGLRKAFHWPAEFTRKFIHIAVGMWSVGTVLLFTNKGFAMIPPLVFVALNYISYRRSTFAAMEHEDKSNLGTVYFPLAFAIVILLTFDVSKALLVAAIMPLTWGDAFAAIIGRRWGRRKYAFAGAIRSIEGSIAMFAFSFASVFIVLVWMEQLRGIDVLWAFVFALVTAAAATLVESISVRGLDNLLVPAVSLLSLGLLTNMYLVAA